MRYKGSFRVYVAAIAVILGILFLIVALDRAVTGKWAYKKVADKQATTIKELGAKVEMHSFNEAMWYTAYGRTQKAFNRYKKDCTRDKEACFNQIAQQDEMYAKEIVHIKKDYTNRNLFKHGDRVFTIPSYSEHYRYKGRIYGKVIYEDENGLVTIELSRTTKNNMLIHRQWLVIDDGSKEPVEEPNPFPFIWENE